VRRIVYVVDISGPMASSLSFVLDELRRSVSRLDSSQQFQVVLFRQDIESPEDAGIVWLGGGGSAGPRMVPATGANRAALAEFLEGVRPSGRSNPLTGLRAALVLEPDVVFLLARGISRTGPNARWGDGNAAILAELEALNPQRADGRRRTAIKTIQFIDDDPTGLMQAIAEAHGGSPGSYTRRNVENLQSGADTPPPVEAPDPNLERAASLLSDLSATRADLRVCFGIASADDLRAVRRVTAKVLELVPEPGGQSDDLTRLVLGRALALRAASGADSNGAASSQMLAVPPPGVAESRGRLLDQAVALLDTSAGAPAEVLSTAAVAHALRQSPGDVDVALALARRAVDLDPNTITAVESRLAAISAAAGDPARSGPWVQELGGSVVRPPFVAGSRLDAPLVLLALDASAAARLRHSASAAEIDAALAQHLDWVRTPRPGLPGEAVRLAAGALVPAGAPLDRIDPDLALARGLALLPAAAERPPDGALGALDVASLRAEPGSATAEIASIRAAMAVSLWAADPASVHAEGGGEIEARVRAIGRLDRALEAFPDRSWRRDAAIHVLAHTGALLDGAGGQGAAPGGPAVDLDAARRRALRVLVLEDPRLDGRTDAWRLELARRTAEQERGDGVMLERAAAMLGGPWAERPADADRLEAWVRSRRVADLAEQLAQARRDRLDARARDLAEALAAAARAAIPVAERVSPEAADALRADLAEALIVGGSPEASEIYADLRERGVTLGRSPAAMALGHARALLAQGDETGGFAVLRDLAASMPEPPAGADHEALATFWHAWTLTIETLAARAAEVADAQPRRDAEAHLLRLHDLDPGLGGEPWASRLRAAGLAVGVRIGEGT
jgi:hypothetical protein